MAPVRSLPSNVLTDVDTSYSRYQVTREVRNGRAVHYLLTDAKGAQSAQFVDAPDEPVFAYIRQMQQIAVTYPDVKRVLIIGGGAFTLPQLLVGQSEDVRVDIVEIDPGLGELSERYFNYQPHPRIATHFEDGRNYLNRDQEPYDLIFLDAFNSLTPPFHLTTLEAAARMWVNLTPDGAIVTNVIDRPDGDFIASMTAVHKRLFRDVEVFAADPTRTSTQRQNLLLLSTQGPLNDETRQLLGKSLGLSGKPTLLTDDYAPVERMTYH
jgi:spermidine synthase